jgi:hypothetical protein
LNTWLLLVVAAAEVGQAEAVVLADLEMLLVLQ